MWKTCGFLHFLFSFLFYRRFRPSLYPRTAIGDEERRFLPKIRLPLGASAFWHTLFRPSPRAVFRLRLKIVRHDFAERAIGTRSLTSKLVDSLRLIITANKKYLHLGEEYYCFSLFLCAPKVFRLENFVFLHLIQFLFAIAVFAPRCTLVQLSGTKNDAFCRKSVCPRGFCILAKKNLRRKTEGSFYVF